MNPPWLKFLPGKGREGAKLPLPLGSVVSTTGSHAVTTLAGLRVFFSLLTLKQITLDFPSTVQGGVPPSLSWASLDWLLTVTGQLELG